MLLTGVEVLKRWDILVLESRWVDLHTPLSSEIPVMVVKVTKLCPFQLSKCAIPLHSVIDVREDVDTYDRPSE